MTLYEKSVMAANALVGMEIRRQEMGVTITHQPILLSLLGKAEWLCRFKIGEIVKLDKDCIHTKPMDGIEAAGLVISRPIENSPGGLRRRKEYQLTELGADKIDYIINGGAKP